MIKRGIHYVIDAVRRPRDELTRRQKQMRMTWDFSAHCWRVLRRHRAEGMAAELTYRSIFALIPLFVLGLVMFRVVGGLEEVRTRVETELYAFFGVPDITYSEPFGSASAAEDDEPEDDEPEDGEPSAVVPTDETLRDTLPTELADSAPLTTEAPDHIDDDPEATEIQQARSEQEQSEQAEASIRIVLSTAIDKVAELDFRSIGIAGLLLFIYAAVALADSVEDVFNNIFEASLARPIHLRLAIHWSIITLGSGLLAMSLYLSSQIVEYISGTSHGAGLQTYLSHLVAVLASWILLFLLYALMPNASVSVSAAAIGALVAALLWEAAKYGFQIYVHTALPYSALYGSLGLIPLFLFWVYVTWLIVLFGLVWTYSVQNFQGRVPTRAEDEAVTVTGDPAWMLPIMVEVARGFEEGERITMAVLVERLGLPDRAVHQMCEVLTEAGLLLSSDGEGKTVLVPARPAEKISAAEVMKLPYYGRSRITHGPAWEYLDRLRSEEVRRASHKTIADLVKEAQHHQTESQATESP